MTRALVSLLLLASMADANTTQLVAQAKAALGGEKALASVHGLSAAGAIQRTIGDRTVDGELSLDLQLPDRMLRTDSISPMGDQTTLITTQGLNGDKLLRSARIVNAPPGAMIRTPPPPAAGSDAEAQALRASRAELARLSMALLLAAPASFPIELSAAGQAESPDGKADVLDLKGPGSFAARLFLDAATHRPLMLTYRGIAPQMIVRAQRGGPPPNAAPSPEPQSEPVDITLYLDDYRRVDGILLPHHIVRAIDGRPQEEWTFKTITLNPPFKADAFSNQ